MKTPVETTRAFATTAKRKVDTKFSNLVVLGIFAGIYSALGGIGAQVVQASISDGFGKVLSSFVFPVGSILINCCGGVLFTGNCLMVIGYQHHNITLKELVKYLLIVYFSNFLGCLLVVCCVRYSGLCIGTLAEIMISTAERKVALSPLEAVNRGILCSILVNLGSWISYASSSLSGKILGVFFPTMLFFLCGFEQCITNMYFIPIGMLLNREITMLGFLSNLLFVTIGNLIGGAVIVGIGYWSVYVKDAEF